MAEKWIQAIHMKKGALTAKAKKAGGISKSGKIKPEFIAKAAKSSNPKTRKQANLAKTLKKLHK